ncbi:hypothetical protein Mapa_015974 [Marchantia paleacea]|nr:hypothetical protein Mapa_015974 [Marchantia paleacea]
MLGSVPVCSHASKESVHLQELNGPVNGMDFSNDTLSRKLGVLVDSLVVESRVSCLQSTWSAEPSYTTTILSYSRNRTARLDLDTWSTPKTARENPKHSEQKLTRKPTCLMY